MLYDPRWDKRYADALNDPMSVESLIAWLETMPADRWYPRLEGKGCLLGQYFRAKGYARAFTGVQQFHYSPWWTLGFPVSRDYPAAFDEIAWTGNGEATFGAALARARAAL